MNKHWILTIISACLLTFSLTGCGCKHETWNEATCQAPKTCAECGETEGEITDHKWADATCQVPKTCEICGETEGEITDHRWAEATCQAPKTCEFCGETKGKVTDHKWLEATCESPRICEYCGKMGTGKALGHNYGRANCTERRTCTRCGETEKVPTGHNWKAATCTTQKRCTNCGMAEGTTLGHDFADATCTKPAICVNCGYENLNPVGGHNWYELNGEKTLCCHRCSASIDYIGLFTIRSNVDDGWDEFQIYYDPQREYIREWIPDKSNLKIYNCGQSDEGIYYGIIDNTGGYLSINNLSPEHALDYQQGGSSSAGGNSSGGSSSTGKTLADVEAYFNGECAKLEAENNADAMLTNYRMNVDYYQISYYVPKLYDIYKIGDSSFITFVTACQNLSSSFKSYLDATGFSDYHVRVTIGMDPPDGSGSGLDNAIVGIEIRDGEIRLNMLEQYLGRY